MEKSGVAAEASLDARQKFTEGKPMEIVSALLYLAMALPDISAASDAGAPQVIERFSEKKDCESFVDKIKTHGTMKVQCVSANVFLYVARNK